MFWLRSSICHVFPPFSERYNAFCGGTASMNAYTTSSLDGATVTATRPHGFGGKPDALVTVAPELPGRAHVDRVGLRRIDEDLHDVLGVAQAHVRPVVAAIVRPVDP